MGLLVRSTWPFFFFLFTMLDVNYFLFRSWGWWGSNAWAGVLSSQLCEVTWREPAWAFFSLWADDGREMTDDVISAYLRLNRNETFLVRIFFWIYFQKSRKSRPSSLLFQVELIDAVYSSNYSGLPPCDKLSNFWLRCSVLKPHATSFSTGRWFVACCTSCRVSPLALIFYSLLLFNPAMVQKTFDESPWCFFSRHVALG